MKLANDDGDATLEKLWDAVRHNALAIALLQNDIDWMKWALGGLLALTGAILAKTFF